MTVDGKFKDPSYETIAEKIISQLFNVNLLVKLEYIVLIMYAMHVYFVE